jgi:hypothetical protein
VRAPCCACTGNSNLAHGANHPAAVWGYNSQQRTTGSPNRCAQLAQHYLRSKELIEGKQHHLLRIHRQRRLAHGANHPAALLGTPPTKSTQQCTSKHSQQDPTIASNHHHTAICQSSSLDTSSGPCCPPVPLHPNTNHTTGPPDYNATLGQYSGSRTHFGMLLCCNSFCNGCHVICRVGWFLTMFIQWPLGQGQPRPATSPH